MDDDGPRAPSISRQRIAADLPEIVAGAETLVERRWSFEAAMTDHLRRRLALHHGDPTPIWLFDDVHARYLPR